MLEYQEFTQQQTHEIQKSFQWQRRGILGISGPSGVGKSRVLHHLAGIHQQHQSEATINWQSSEHDNLIALNRLKAHQRPITLVEQNQPLFPHLSVWKNLKFASNHAHNNSSSQHFQELVKQFDLRELLPKYPFELSGGQRNRVAVVQGILALPQLLLLDEPFAALDKHHRYQMLSRLTAISKNLDLAMIMVSHQQSDLAQCCQQILFVSENEISGPFTDVSSRLNQKNFKEQSAQDLTAYIKAELKEIDSEEAVAVFEVDEVEWVLSVAPSSSQPLKQQTMMLALPSHEVSLIKQRPVDSSIANCIEVLIDEIQQMDQAVQLKLTLKKQFIFAKITRKSLHQLDLKRGDRIFAQFKATAVEWLK